MRTFLLIDLHSNVSTDLGIRIVLDGEEHIFFGKRK